MGWFSKIFRGSCRNFLDGRYGTNTYDDHQCTTWHPSPESEDREHITLPLSGEDEKGNVDIDKETPKDEDIQLPESLNIYSQPSSSRNDYDADYGYRYGYGYDNHYQPITFPYYPNFRTCAGCNTEIGHGRFFNCMSAVWHPECFRCCGCNQPIYDYEFSVYSGYPYHKSCYEVSHYPRCDICRHSIPTNTAGLIEYKAHPFWSQKYCPKHEHDGTRQCCSCERMESRNTRVSVLKDGRKLCLDCLESAIMDVKECEPLFHDIQQFFEELDMKVTQQVPLLLVEKQALNKAIGEEKHGHHHNHMPETRGICLTEERAARNMGDRNHVTVTAILILYGLPRLLTGTILAHEMMHAWLRLNGYRNLRVDLEEGICQVVARMWLHSRHKSVSDKFERKLIKFYKFQIATDSSLVYGNGFRAAHHAIQNFGLHTTLRHIRTNPNFPY